MGAIASQITSLTIVYSTVYSDADQRKYQSSASLAFVWGIHRWPVNSPAQMASNAENVSIWWRHHGHPAGHYWENYSEETVKEACLTLWSQDCVCWWPNPVRCLKTVKVLVRVCTGCVIEGSTKAMLSTGLNFELLNQYLKLGVLWSWYYSLLLKRAHCNQKHT